MIYVIWWILLSVISTIFSLYAWTKKDGGWPMIFGVVAVACILNALLAGGRM